MSAELAPVPGDTKDWTWVLQRSCPECGLDAGALAPTEVAGRVLDATRAWRAVLGRDGVRDRPDPTTWSPLEYSAHVRDVLRTADVRLTSLLEQDDPVFADWDQDATALADRYGEQVPAAVAEQLDAAAQVVARRLDGVVGGAWQRPGRRSNGSVFTVATLAQYVLHDVVHHLHDVAR